MRTFIYYFLNLDQVAVLDFWAVVYLSILNHTSRMCQNKLYIFYAHFIYYFLNYLQLD